MTKSTRYFIRHYAEMVAAMFLGMGVLFAPALVALGAAGVSSSELRSDVPVLLLLGMGVTMTVPMVAWMRYRGHGRAASNEMAASMLIPTAGVMALQGAGLADVGTLLVVEHVVMLPAMLVAMLLRRDEYTQGAHRGRGRASAAAAA
jgi:hypothetical protein